MPNGTIVADDYIDDPNRTVSEVQAALNQNFDYLRSLQAEMAALSSTVLREASVRSIGNSTGNVPDKAVIDARLGTTGNIGPVLDNLLNTTGNLGSAATENYQTETIVLGNNFGLQTMQVTRIGNLVTLAPTAILTHANIERPRSSFNILPIWAVPTNDFYFNTYHFSPQIAGGGLIIDFQYANGAISLYYRKADGSFRGFENSVSVPSLTYFL